MFEQIKVEEFKNWKFYGVTYENKILFKNKNKIIVFDGYLISDEITINMTLESLYESLEKYGYIHYDNTIDAERKN